MPVFKDIPHRFFRIIIALIFSSVLNGISTTPAQAVDAVVGGLCDEAAFEAALATVQSFKVGGTITFDCGSAPFYVYFSANKTITGDVTIDGGGLAILSGMNTTRLLFVSAVGELTLKDITLSNGYSGTGDGGAVYNYYGSLTVSGSKFLNNSTHTDFNGGAIASYGSLTITESEFINNGSGAGGAIASYGPLTITESTFTSNHSGGGGAVFLQFSTGVGSISGSVFEGNDAHTPDGASGGALLAADGAELVVSDSHLENNHALTDGGGISVKAGSRLDLLDSTLEENSSVEAGGALSIGGTAAITQTVITANRSTKNGGGLYNSGTTSVFNSLISSNDADIKGGGIHNSASGIITITSSTVFSNTTNYWGAGLYDDGDAAILNSAFIHNRAQGGTEPKGGAIFASGSTTVNFSTFLDNAAIGDGALGATIYSEGALNLSLKNSIIRSQTSACSGALTSQGYNIVSDPSCSLFLPSDQPSTDPKLGLWYDEKGMVWHTLPLPSSPAIDQAQCGTVTTDMRRSMRPIGVTCDIGALERFSRDPSAYLFLALIRR